MCGVLVCSSFSIPTHLFVVGHASNGLPISDVIWAMPEPKAVHLLRRPDIHLVIELSELCASRETADEPNRRKMRKRQHILLRLSRILSCALSYECSE